MPSVYLGISPTYVWVGQSSGRCHYWYQYLSVNTVLPKWQCLQNNFFSIKTKRGKTKQALATSHFSMNQQAMTKITQADGSRVQAWFLTEFPQQVHVPFSSLKTPLQIQGTVRCTTPMWVPHVFPRAASSEPPTGTLIRYANNLSTAELGTFIKAALHLKYHHAVRDHTFLGSGWGRVQGEGFRLPYYPTFPVGAASGQYITSLLALFNWSQELGFIKAKWLN